MVGDQNKQSFPIGSSRGLDIVERESVSANTNSLIGIPASTDGNDYHGNSDSRQRLNTGVRESQFNGLRKAQRHQRISPSVLHFLLMIGDSLLLVSVLFLTLRLAPFIHLGVQTPSSIFGIAYTKYVWIYFALIAWYAAVGLTHTQNPKDAASPLKSPLSMQCTLVVMFIFWVGLIYIFIGNRVLTSIKPIFFFFMLALPIFSAWRVLFAEILNMPGFRRRAVIVGINTAGATLVNELKDARHPGVNILGYIGENGEERGEQNELAILGRASALHYMASKDMIDMIIMALDYKANPELYQAAFEASQFGISVVPIALVYEGVSGKVPLEYLGDQWSVALQSERFVSSFYLLWNKMIDIAFGLCGLLALCLVFPILALLISLDSPGPIFYTQERAGYHGRTFRILKFRSMTVSTATGKEQWTTEHDPRITRIGRFMRATHLDELPQMLNILGGDMSLIGPRPERPAYIAELAKENIFYSYRLSIKPGLTGWAQVKYGYGSGEQDELVKLQYDLYYVKHRSFLLDVLILLKTVGEVVLCHGI